MVLALVLIEGKDYALEFEEDGTFVADGLSVAYCEELARDYLPIIYDPRGYGSNPKPPELIAYRLVVDKNRQRLCVIYEVYWKSRIALGKNATKTTTMTTSSCRCTSICKQALGIWLLYLPLAQ